MIPRLRIKVLVEEIKKMLSLNKSFYPLKRANNYLFNL